MAAMNRWSRWVVNHLGARANAGLYRWLAEHLRLPPAAVCLEIGCGNGNMAVRIVDGMGPSRFVATDLDLAQMQATERYVAAHYPNGPPSTLEFRPADMTRLPFPDEGFDAVFAFATLHHAGENHRDPARVPDALAEADRVLRPGGLLAYEEFLFKDRIRGWLAQHGYREAAVQHGWRRDRVVAQKSGEPAARRAGEAAPVPVVEPG